MKLSKEILNVIVTCLRFSRIKFHDHLKEGGLACDFHESLDLSVNSVEI